MAGQGGWERGVPGKGAWEPGLLSQLAWEPGLLSGVGARLETETRVEDRVEMTLIRSGQEVKVSVTLVERPEQP